MSMEATPNKIPQPSDRQRLVLAVVIPLAAFGLQWLCWRFIEPYVWFLFFPAVFFSSWIGGKRGGLLATVLSAVLVWYFFIPPQLSFTLEKNRLFISVGLFVGMGILFSYFHERLRQANQQLAAAAARESDERLRLVLAATADGIWDWNLQTGMAYLSPRYGDITGYHEVEMVANLDFFKRLIHPEDWPAVEQAMNDHLAGKTPQSMIEYRMIVKGGTEKWIWGRGQVVERGPSGQPLRMVGTITDITESKRAEEKLRVSEERFQQLAETITDVFWMASPDLKAVLYVSPGYERVWGRPTESLYASPHQWMESILPED